MKKWILGFLGGSLLCLMGAGLVRPVQETLLAKVAAELATHQIEVRAERCAGWWPWSMEVQGVTIVAAEQTFRADRLGIQMGPLDWLHLLFGRWRWSRLEVEGLSGGSPCRDLAVGDGWVSFVGDELQWRVEAPSDAKMWESLSGQYSKQKVSSKEIWRLSTHLQIPGDGLLVVNVDGEGEQWHALLDMNGCGQLPRLRDSIEWRLHGDATGRGSRWKTDLKLEGLWERGDIPHECAGTVHLEGRALDQASARGLFKSPLGEMRLDLAVQDRQVQGSVEATVDELRDLITCCQPISPIIWPAVEGQLDLRCDVHGPWELLQVKAQATLEDGQMGGVQADEVICTATWQEGLHDLPQEMTCRVRNLWGGTYFLEEGTLKWSTEHQQGEAQLVGRCAGPFRLNTTWQGIDPITLETLEGELFGQELRLEAPYSGPLLSFFPWMKEQRTSAQGPLRLSWGKGSLDLSGSSEESSLQFVGQDVPLEWVGLLVAPIECTGFGSLELSANWKETPLALDGHLRLPEACVLVHALQGTLAGELDLTSDTNGVHLDGALQLKSAQLLLSHAMEETTPEVDLEWVTWHAQPQVSSSMLPALDYRVKIVAPPSIPVACGPLMSYWSGEAQLFGTSDGPPALEGQLSLSRGKMELFGIPLQVREGLCTLKGLSPEQIELFLCADTPLPSGSLTISCSGPLSEPVLSLVGPQELSTAQVLEQLANVGEGATDPTATKLLGLALQWLPHAAPQFMQGLKKATGLDQIELTSVGNTAEHLRLVLGKQVTNRILVQLYETIGADRDGMTLESGVSVEAAIGRSFTVQAEVAQPAKGRVSVRWKRHY